MTTNWTFYNTSGSKLRIGVEDGFNKWKFVIHKDCPTRLRGRVSKESTATLVISNVTVADSGVYGCELVLLSGSPIRSRVKLVVTERPRFITPVNLTTPVIEGSVLIVQCLATANPMPNVTWFRIIEDKRFISTGVGEVFLRLSNITRYQSGTYECQATNNPNEDPVTTRTVISVKFPVEPSSISVSDIRATSAVIKWLSPLDRGGSAIIDYKIQINTTPPREIIIKTTSYVIKNLKVNTTYSVKVYARNAAGYGKAKYTVFSTARRKKSVGPTSPSLQKITCGLPTSFYQERTFAIIHLSTTSVLVIVIIILILYIFIIFKRNSPKDNRYKVTRYSPSVLFRGANQDTVDITSTEHTSNNEVLTVGNASMLYRKEDDGNIPERFASTFHIGNAAQGVSARDVQQSPTHHDYQGLSNDDLSSKKQDNHSC